MDRKQAAAARRVAVVDAEIVDTTATCTAIAPAFRPEPIRITVPPQRRRRRKRNPSPAVPTVASMLVAAALTAGAVYAASHLGKFLDRD